ncbi:MAG: acyl-CoA dehydrogenase family protein, partial [Sulfuritalea sp.]|nr:acyl-CoA dehydrogenase family protein [Sulfuritalea sp.]
MSGIINRRDLEFQLFEVLDTEALTAHPRYAEHSKEIFLAVLDTAQAMASEKFAPHNHKSDANEPSFGGGQVRMIPEVREALQAFCEAGFIAAAHDFERGGMQLPVTMTQAAFSLFSSANVATAAY